jgi:hypothetical protein
MQYFIPKKGITVERDGSEQQSFLTQVLLPKMSNSKDSNEIYKFFKDAQKEDLEKDFETNRKIISLNSSYGCDFESELRFASLDDREAHMKLMQSLRPEQKAVLSPFVRLYLIPNPFKTKMDLKKAIPISFGKGFDTDFFLGKREDPSLGGFGDRLTAELRSPFGTSNDATSFSRGEAAYIKSLQVDRIYNNTGVYDPIYVNMSFFFSSFDVFANKPAIEKSAAGATFLNRVARSGNIHGGFSTINDLRYTELITYQTNRSYRLLLEYGWTVDDSVSESIFSFLDKQLIKKFEKTFYLLNPTTHNIKFREDGGLDMTVNYIPAVLDNLDKSVDFKTGVFYDKNTFSKIQGSLSDDAKKTLVEIDKLSKQKFSNDEEELKRRQKIAEYRKRLSDNKNTNFANIFKDYFEKSGLIYNATVKTDLLKNPDRTAFTLKLSRKRSDRTLEVRDTYTFENVKKRIKDLQKKATTKKTVRFLGLSLKEEEDATTEEVQKVSDDIFKKIFEPSEESTTIRFVLLKDVMAFLLKMSDTVESGNKSPFTILSNFAMPLPDGRKFWCNLGDIPIELKLLKNILNVFFNQRPNGSAKNFLHYMLNDVLPEILVEKSKRFTLPSFAFPFFHFNRDKWVSEGKEEYISLLEGDKAKLKSFGANFFDESSFNGSIGCIFVGQSPRLSYQNSKINLGRNVKLASDAFLKDDNQLIKLGIGKMIIGSATGLVKSINFNALGDQSIQNLNYQLNKLKPGVDDILLSSAFQYTLSAQLFGNKIYEFTNLVYVPAGSIGYAPLAPQQVLNRGGFDDFELGGLYYVNKTSDNLDMQQGTYTKTINATTVKRESQLVTKSLKLIKKDSRKEVLFPTDSPKVNFADYIYGNSENIDRIFKVKIDKINATFEDAILAEALENQFEDEILDEALEGEERERQAAEARISNLNRVTGVQPVPEVGNLNTEAFSKPFGSSGGSE